MVCGFGPSNSMSLGVSKVLISGEKRIYRLPMFVMCVTPASRLLTKAASGVLARHCRLTGSAAFTNVTRVTPRVVNLRGSPYGTSTIRLFACCGLAGPPFSTACGGFCERL